MQFGDGTDMTSSGSRQLHLRVVAFLFVAWPAFGQSSDDFSVSGEVTQQVVADTRRVVVRCYCPKREVRSDPAAQGVQLRIAGTHSSVGYHGPQEKPSALDPELLRFVERREGEVLTLESREYTYIHHALIVDKLQVLAPPTVQITVQPLERDKLERRRVGK